MVPLYFDSSAFVKLLVEEEGSDLAADLWNGADMVASSRLAYPEVCAALAAAGRAARLSNDALEHATRLWDAVWEAVQPLELTSAGGHQACYLARHHALRGADAVHLAAGLGLGSETILVAWDARLRAGAEGVGLRLAPSSL